MVEEAQVVVHKAYQPDSLIDLSDADGLSCEGLTEVDLALPDADATAAGDDDVRSWKGYCTSSRPL